MLIAPFIKYTYSLDNTISFGAIPTDEVILEFSSGRINGPLLERDCSHRFHNLFKRDAKQGNGPDLYVELDYKTSSVQCKTVRLCNKGKQLGDIGWTTKSGLWDTKRGVKKSCEEWDAEHNAYFSSYDYFVYQRIDKFPVIELIMVPTGHLRSYREVINLQEDKAGSMIASGKNKGMQLPRPTWDYPTTITIDMWFDFAPSSTTELE